MQRSEFESFWTEYADSPLEGRNVIISSFCSQVFGLYIVKLAICLALAGGVQVSSVTCVNQMTVGLVVSLHYQ